jgi:DNA-binding NarL/FixJ family response regulator
MNKKIILIEDEGLICDLFEDYIGLMDGVDYAGYCQSGDEAMMLIRKKKPDVIVLDIRLPGISGLDLLPKIRAEFTDTKIVLFTGSLKPEVAKLAVASRVNAFVEKAYGFNELTRAIEAVLRGEGFTTPGVAKYCMAFPVLQEQLSEAI